MFLHRPKLLKTVLTFAATGAVFFMSGGQALAYTVEARWIDRATIDVTKVEFDDSDHDRLGYSISDPTEAVIRSFGGDAKLREIINAENKGVYKDSAIVDDTYEYLKQNCSKTGTLDLGGGKMDSSDADLIIFKLAYNFNPIGWPYGACNDFIQGAAGGRASAEFHITNEQNKDIWFVASDDLKVLRKVDGADGEYKQQEGGNPNIYYASEGASCDGARNRVTIDEGSKSSAVMTGSYKHCLGRNDTVRVKIVKQSAHPENNPATANAENADSCESHNSTIILGWLICGVINALDSFARTAGETIDSLLTLNSDDFKQSKDLKTVWSLFRNIATFMLIAVALGMLLGQTLGGGGEAVFSAYTIRKVLPRLLIAAIAIQLSWYIMVEIVDAVNDVAHGIEGLLYAPFGGVGQFTLGKILSGNDVNQGLFSALASGGVVLTLGYSLTAGSGTVLGVMAMAGTAVIGLLIAVFALILRQVILIALILISPMALALWVLPNTDKLWKMWYESFSKLLIAYPIILLVIAGGRIFALVGARSNKNQFAIMAIVLLGTVGVFAAIPGILKISGAAYNLLAGSLNDPRRGVFDRLRNVRKSEAEKSRAKFMAGDRYGRNNFAARAVNRVGAGFGVGKAGHFGIGAGGKQAIATMRSTDADNYIKENQRLAKLGQTNDDATAVLGLSGGTRRGAHEAAERLRQHWMEESIAKGMSADDAASQARTRATRALQSAQGVGISQRGAAAALNLMAQNKSRAIGAGRFDLVDEGISRLARGNAQVAREAAYGYQFYSRGAGRADLGGDWTSDSVQASMQAARTATTPQARDQQMASAQRKVFMDAVKRTDTRALVSGHDSTTAEARKIIGDDFRSGDYDRMMESGALLTELAGNLASATGGNRDNIIEAMHDAGIDVANPQDTGAIEQQIAARVNASNPPVRVTPEIIRSYSRTWGSGTPLSDRSREAEAPKNPMGGANP